jgi:hypothetical protein
MESLVVGGSPAAVFLFGDAAAPRQPFSSPLKQDSHEFLRNFAATQIA